MTVVYESLKSFTHRAAQEAIDLVYMDGAGEDPQTHYFAYVAGTDVLVGYFATDDGKDEGYGDWAMSQADKVKLGAEVIHPRRSGW